MGETCLAELLTFTRDGEWGKGEPEDGYVPMQVIRGTDFERVRFGDLSSLPVRYIRHDIAERKKLQADDVLIETAGGTKDQPTGRTVLVRDKVLQKAEHPLICASFARFLRIDAKLADPAYLFWKLQAEYSAGCLHPFHIQHTGVARFQYTQFANSYRFNIPDGLSEQIAIASILNSLDDKIDLNRRMNETLEAMARAIFKDWFVDFGPTRAKMEGREPYLAPELWALFPDRLDDEGKPEGWARRPIDEIANFLNGLALQKYPGTGDDDLPVIKIAELRSGITEKSGRASRNVPQQYIVRDGDILFSWSGSLTHMIWTNGEGALNQHLFKVTSDHYPKWFIYFWLTVHMPEFQSIASSKATTMGHIQRGHLSAAEAIVPRKKALEKADQLISSLFDRMIKNSLESRTLAQTRDLLLPKLMSGEIRVKEAEKIMEETA